MENDLNEVPNQQIPVEPEPAAPVQSKIINKVVNVVEPFSNKLVSIPADQLQDALDDDYRVATKEDVNQYKKELKYGTAIEQAKTAAEAFASDMTFGFSLGAERALGVNPEDIRAREEINPGWHTIGGMAGLATPMGEAKLLTKAGSAAAKALKLGGEGASVANKLASHAVKGAVEMGLYSAGEEVGNVFKEDPYQSASTAAWNFGLNTLFGGIAGGTLGAAAMGVESMLPKGWVSEVEKPALEAGEFSASVKHADNMTPAQKEGVLANLQKRKANADEIEKAARELGITPLEGMVLDSKPVQWAEDSLLNAPPTVAANARRALYDDAFKKAEIATADTLGAKSPYTKAQLGDILKENITTKINEQAAPIEAMYNGIKAVQETIPLAEEAAPALSKSIKQMQEFRVSPSSPQGKMIGRVAKEIENLKTVDDIKAYRTVLNQSVNAMAPAGEKRIAAILSDKLSELEEKSIIAAARSAAKTAEQKIAIEASIKTMAEAKKAYKPFIEKVSQLAEGLGKSRVYGKQDALNFINEHLTAENIVQKLSTKGDSAFREFLSKEFPNEAKTIALYQKNLLREAATKDGVLGVNKVLKDIFKLEPEIQAQIFTKEELQKLSAVKTVMESMPKAANPSRTAHTDEFRKYFEDPKHVAVGNLRDVALTKFVKGVADNSENGIIRKLVNAAALGEKKLRSGIKAVFKHGGDAPIVLAPAVSIKTREKNKKKLDDLTQNPEQLLKLHDHPAIPQEYAESFGQISASAIAYLNSVKPNTDKLGALDPRRVPSQAEIAKYDRALDLAENPLIILNRIKDGTLLPDDMKCVSAIYPKLYERLKVQLTEELAIRMEKNETIPYKTRISLSMFMTQPLDATLQPMSIQAAQAGSVKHQEQQQGQPQGGGNKGSMKALNNMSASYMTPAQARVAHKMNS